MHSPYTPEIQIFFHSTMSRFWVTAQFLEKCTEWPQMNLTWSRSKIPTCMLHTPLWPKFTSVSLYDEPFLSYGKIDGLVHRMTLNDLDMFKVNNTNMHATNTPESQLYIRFSLRWAGFELRPNFRKVHWITPNDLNMFEVKNTNMHATYTHKGLIFNLLHSTVSRFWVAA